MNPWLGRLLVFFTRAAEAGSGIVGERDLVPQHFERPVIVLYSLSTGRVAWALISWTLNVIEHRTLTTTKRILDVKKFWRHSYRALINTRVLRLGMLKNTLQTGTQVRKKDKLIKTIGHVQGTVPSKYFWKQSTTEQKTGNGSAGRHNAFNQGGGHHHHDISSKKYRLVKLLSLNRNFNCRWNSSDFLIVINKLLNITYICCIYELKCITYTAFLIKMFNDQINEWSLYLLDKSNNFIYFYTNF